MKKISISEVPDPLADETCEQKDIITLRRDWIQSQLKLCGREDHLRVLISSNTLGCGGAEHQILQLLQHLHDLGIKAEHFYYSKPHLLRPYFVDKGLFSHFIDRDSLGQWLFWRETIAFIRRKRYDVVHAFTGTANFYARGAALIARTPVIMGGWRSRNMGNLFLRIFFSLLNLKTCAWVINASSNVEAFYNLWGMSRLRTYVAPNVIAFDDKDYNSTEVLSPELSAWINGRFVIGTVGRISPAKNFDLFIDCASKIVAQRQDVCFILVGGTEDNAESRDLEAHLFRRVEKENLSAYVRFLGRSDNVPGLLPHFTLFLCTSSREGCPNAVIEAMRAQLPIVMTNCTDTRYLIEEGHSGYVVSLNDVDGMVQRIHMFLDDPGRRRQCGMVGCELSRKYFDAATNTWLLARIYVKEWKLACLINSKPICQN